MTKRYILQDVLTGEFLVICYDCQHLEEKKERIEEEDVWDKMITEH